MFKKIVSIVFILLMAIVIMDSLIGREEKDAPNNKASIFDYGAQLVKSPPEGEECLTSSDIEKCEILEDRNKDQWGLPTENQYVIEHYGESSSGYWYYQIETSYRVLRSKEDLFK